MGLLDKKKSLLTDEQSHWGDVANRLGADISNYGGSALRGLLKGTVGLPVGLHNLVSDVTGRGTKIDTLSPEWVGKKVQPYLPDGNTKTEIAGEFINPLGAIKAASIPLMGLMFAGKGAKTADLFKLREAEEMLKKGASDRDAYAKTGWTHGFADEKPRFEIDDSGSALTSYVTRPPSGDDMAGTLQQMAREQRRKKGIGDPKQAPSDNTMLNSLPLSQSLIHKDLYNNYPHMKDMFASVSQDKGRNAFIPNTYYRFGEENPQILANAGADTKQALLHELDHAIQNKEGFARGGSSSEFSYAPAAEALKRLNGDIRKLNSLVGDKLTAAKGNIPEILRIKKQYPQEYKEINDVLGQTRTSSVEDAIEKISAEYKNADDLIPYNQYHKLAGEASSRLTEKRMNMTAAERAKSYPPDMFDVPVEDQIVSFGGGKQMMSEGEPTGLLGKNKLSLEKRTSDAYDLMMKGNNFSDMKKYYALKSELDAVNNKGLAKLTKPPAADTGYRISHQPKDGPDSDNPIRLDNITRTVNGESGGYPDDFYSSSGPRLYAPPPRFANDEYGIANKQSYDVIKSVKGNPDAEVTIYRAVPNEKNIKTINRGDFVTLSPKYAELHGASGYGRNGNDAGKVLSQKVKVKDIYFGGDDVNEFGYFPEKTGGLLGK